MNQGTLTGFRFQKRNTIMAEQSAAYKWFWQKMAALTESRPMSAAEKAQYQQDKAKERFDRFKQNIGLLNDFLSDAKKALEPLKDRGEAALAKSFVAKLLGPVNVLNHAVGATSEAIEAAEQVSRELATWYKQADDQARQQAGGDDDQYWILSAALVRKWQARNVKAVLSTDKNSFVMLLWPKWRDRIFSLVF
jgi:primosomal protein N''